MNTTKNQSPQSISETPKEKQTEDNLQICKCNHPIDNHIEQINGKVIAGECINCECKEYQSPQTNTPIQIGSRRTSQSEVICSGSKPEVKTEDNLHKKQQDLEKEIKSGGDGIENY